MNRSSLKKYEKNEEKTATPRWIVQLFNWGLRDGGKQFWLYLLDAGLAALALVAIALSIRRVCIHFFITCASHYFLAGQTGGIETKLKMKMNSSCDVMW